MSHDFPLPPGYRFLATNFELTEPQEKELVALSKRWEEIDQKYGFRFGPGEPWPEDFELVWPDLEWDLREFGHRHGFMVDPAMSACTIGWLIEALKNYEEVKTRRAEAKGAALFGSAEALSRIADQKAQLTISDAIAKAPGIDRIEFHCHKRFAGTGATLPNVRQLRAEVLEKSKWRSEWIQCVDQLSLDEAADILDGVIRTQPLVLRPTPFATVRTGLPSTTADRQARRRCSTHDMDLVAPSIHFGNPHIDNETTEWVCPKCYEEQHLKPLADDIPPPALLHIANIEAQIEELKRDGFSIGTTRKAFDMWRRLENQRNEIRATVENAAQRTKVLRKLMELDCLCQSILRRFCEQNKLDPRSFVEGKENKRLILMPDGRRCWEHDADLIEMALRAAGPISSIGKTDEAHLRENDSKLQSEEFVFAKTASGYIVRGFGERGFVSDLVGFGYLLHLLKCSGETVRYEDLLSSSAGCRPRNAILTTELEAREEGVQGEGIRGTVQEGVPMNVRRDLQKELLELSETRKEAERTENQEEYDRCELEIREIEAYIRASKNHKGMPRDINNQAGKKAPSIHTAKNRACADLKKNGMPKLAAHFLESISETDGCGFKYHPVPSIDWSFNEPAP